MTDDRKKNGINPKVANKAKERPAPPPPPVPVPSPGPFGPDPTPLGKKFSLKPKKGGPDIGPLGRLRED